MEFVDKILTEGEDVLNEARVIGFQNPAFGNFVVMMGSPGAGKTFVAKNLLGLTNYKHLAGDNWLEMIAKKQGLDLGNPAVTHDLNSKYEDKFKDFRKNFIQLQLQRRDPVNVIVDITGKSVQSVKKALDIVEHSHYITTLVYVITSKEECLKRNLNRGRKVPEDFLMSVYDDIEQTYNAVFTLFDNVWLMLNNELWETFSGEEEYIEVDGKKFLKTRMGAFNRPTNRIFKTK